MIFQIRHISQLSSGQISQARRWVIFSIFIVFFAQSLLAFLYCFSTNSPVEFNNHNAQIDQKMTEVHKRIIDLLDFGQKPTQKKQNSFNLAFSFNLFVEEPRLTIPTHIYSSVPKQLNYFYKTGYCQDFQTKLLRPPQSI